MGTDSLASAAANDGYNYIVALLRVSTVSILLPVRGLSGRGPDGALSELKDTFIRTTETISLKEPRLSQRCNECGGRINGISREQRNRLTGTRPHPDGRAYLVVLVDVEQCSA